MHSPVIAHPAPVSALLLVISTPHSRLPTRARSCLGWALQARGEADGALEEIEQALSMSPNLAIAHGHRGATLIFAGRFKEGLSALKTCIRLDPHDPFMAVRLLHIASGLYFCGEY